MKTSTRYFRLVQGLVSQQEPSPTFGATKQFSEGYEQRLVLISSTVILQNPCVTIYTS